MQSLAHVSQKTQGPRVAAEPLAEKVASPEQPWGRGAPVRDGGQPLAAVGAARPGKLTSEKPALLLGSTNNGFRASSLLAKSRACGRQRRGHLSHPSHRAVPGLHRHLCFLRRRHTLGYSRFPSHPRDTRRGTHPPEFQALLHDGVGGEENQKPVGDHAGDVAWKCSGLGQREGHPEAPTSGPRASEQGWGGARRAAQSPRNGAGPRASPRTHLEPSPRRTSTRQRTCTEPGGSCDRAQHSARPPARPSAPGPYLLSKAELSWVPSGPLGTIPTQIWCLSMTCGFSRETGKGLEAAGGAVRP